MLPLIVAGNFHFSGTPVKVLPSRHPPTPYREKLIRFIYLIQNIVFVIVDMINIVSIRILQFRFIDVSSQSPQHPYRVDVVVFVAWELILLVLLVLLECWCSCRAEWKLETVSLNCQHLVLGAHSLNLGIFSLFTFFFEAAFYDWCDFVQFHKVFFGYRLSKRRLRQILLEVRKIFFLQILDWIREIFLVVNFR